MDLDKDSQQVLEKLMENGLYSIGIEDNVKIMELENKLMDIILSILLNKIINISILIISEILMQWMLLSKPSIIKLMFNIKLLVEYLILDSY